MISRRNRRCELRRLRQLPLAARRPSTARWRRRSFSRASIASARRAASAWAESRRRSADAARTRRRSASGAIKQLSTYGIGTEHTPRRVGRDRARTGAARLPVPERGEVQHPRTHRRGPRRAQVAPEDHAHQTGHARRSRRSIAPARSPATRRCSSSCAQLRKQLADERGVPPYIIFSDVALRQMARVYPANDREFARISGVGEKKLREFGAAFLARDRGTSARPTRARFSPMIPSPNRPPRRALASHRHRARDVAFFPAGKVRGRDRAACAV